MRKLFILGSFLLLISFLFISCDINIRTNVEEKKINQKPSNVEVEIDSEFVKSKNIDSILIESVLLDRSSMPTKLVSNEYTRNEIENKTSLSFDLKNFGKSEVTVYYKKNGKTVKKDYLDYTLTSDRYNIAFLIATVPVSYFTLMMVDQDGNGDIIDPTLPTILSLERAASYNFDELLPNMYMLPFVSEEKIRNCGINGKNYRDEFLRATYDYVAYLHELNPNSTFNIISYDRSPEDAIVVSWCNGLDPRKNRITLLSDGVGTYGDFRASYGEEENDGIGKYNAYEEKWKKIKKEALSGNIYFANIEKLGSPFSCAECQLVAYNAVMINDEDIDFKWVFARKNKDTFGPSDVFTEKISGNPNAITLNMQDYVRNSGGKLDSEEIKNLKALFNFNESVFEEAEKKGKKCVIFLGTATSAERDGDNNDAKLRDYLSFMTHYLDKNEYAFFYKGHPGHIFSYKERNDIVNSFGVEILDPAIPAELFYLFKNEIDMCGYQSSTFQVFPETYRAPFVNEEKDYAALYFTKKDSNGVFKIVKKGTSEVCYWNPNTPENITWVTEGA